MNKHITIKDIAQEAAVSTGTVHRALYGKKGVSDQARQRILDICAKRGYRINAAASALKRGRLRIAAAFPGPDGKNLYFYSNVWRGFRRYLDELGDFDIDVIELPYGSEPACNQAALLAGCFAEYNGEIDALITIGHFTAECKNVVRQYSGRGIPVFLACDDTRDCGRIACVQANYNVTGRIVAELLSSQLPSGSAVLLLTGDELIPSHAQTVQGFEAYLRENRVDLAVRKLSGYANEPALRARILETLIAHPDVSGAFSVSARLSVLLADAVSGLAKADAIRVVASDLFAETFHNMESGIVKNIIFKDPEQQAYLATKLMCDYLLKAEKPQKDVFFVESRVIFKSNLLMYRE